MGHKSFALTSTVAAVPAAVLIYFLVMYGFLQHADKMNVTLLGLVVVTLLCSFAIAVMPVAILITGAPRKKKPAAEAPAKAAPAAAVVAGGDSSEANVAEFESSDEAAAFDSSGEAAAFDSSGEAAVFDSDKDMVDASEDLQPDATTSFSTPAEGSDVELGDSDTFGDSGLSEFDEIEDEVILEDDEDEDPPSRKKKR